LIYFIYIAGHNYIQNRNDDFSRILKELVLTTDNDLKLIKKKSNSENSLNYEKLPKTMGIKNENIKIYSKFDYAFLMGDLNYRIEKDEFFIHECLKHNNLNDILIHDQLINEAKNGRLNLYNFTEGEINFPPTYKFIPGTDKYDKQKLPGWTDRILYHQNTDIRNLNINTNIKTKLKLTEYNCIKDVYLSDHKPVKATFELIIFKKDTNFQVDIDSNESTFKINNANSMCYIF
jgi:hypothetical protein